MELQRTLGANVRHYRRSKRWTLERLASEVGVSRETIGKIERGVSAPLFETVERIALALNASPATLFGAQPFPAGERGKLLLEIHSVLANLNDKQLASAHRMLTALYNR
jgi:transcriptional regulator with XRE-family HTH domain